MLMRWQCDAVSTVMADPLSDSQSGTPSLAQVTAQFAFLVAILIKFTTIRHSLGT